MDAREVARHVRQINEADAKALVKILEEAGDAENLQRAQDDLKQWRMEQYDTGRH